MQNTLLLKINRNSTLKLFINRPRISFKKLNSTRNMILINQYSVYILESETVIDTDEALAKALSDFTTSISNQGEGASKLTLTFVFCPEKELLLKKTDTSEEVKED